MNELKAVVNELVEEGRERLGEPPSDETLLAYSRGELSEEEADRVQELLALYPDSVRDLAALTSFPEKAAPGDPDYLSDEELQRHWVALQEHLPPEQRQMPAPEPQPAAASVLPQDRQDPPTRWWSWLFPVPVTAYAVVLSAIAVFLVWDRQGIQQTLETVRKERVNYQATELRPDGVRNVAVNPPIPLRFREGHQLLIPMLADERHFAEYRLEIHPQPPTDSAPLLEARGLQRRDDDTFEFLLHRDFLPEGDYQIRLYGRNGADDEQELARYTVTVQR